MAERGRFAGVLTIIRFNWPAYVVGSVVMVAAAVMVVIAPHASLLALGAWVALGVSLWFVVGSSLASHWIYDRSDLYRFGWLGRALGGAGSTASERAVFCRTGFDECSDALRERLAGCELRVLEHFAEATMTEPSIRRAQQGMPRRADVTSAAFDAWPLEDGRTGVVFGILSIHELRRASERVAWFGEARRCLAAGGRIVLVEHARDVANFLAFGPGFVHFLSPRTWRASWEAAGFACRDEFLITPFLRVFVLEVR